MTNDDFLDTWRADWRRQPIDTTGLAARVERRRRRTRLALIAKAVGTGVALLFSAWFGWLALKGAPAIFALAGIVLLVALPLMVLDLAGMARSLSIGHGDAPSVVLRRACDQAAISRHLLWGYRAASLLLSASAAGLLALYATGRARAEEAIVFVPLWGLIALGSWAWQARRGRGLAAEVARCDALLAELGEADNG